MLKVPCGRNKLTQFSISFFFRGRLKLAKLYGCGGNSNAEVWLLY